MAKTSRIELRVEPDLKARVAAEADRCGQKVATFVERALERALENSRSESVPDMSAAPSPPETFVATRPLKSKPSIRDTWAR